MSQSLMYGTPPLLSHLEGDHYHPGDFTRTSAQAPNSTLPLSSPALGSDRNLQSLRKSQLKKLSASVPPATMNYNTAELDQFQFSGLLF